MLYFQNRMSECIWLCLRKPLGSNHNVPHCQSHDQWNDQHHQWWEWSLLLIHICLQVNMMQYPSSMRTSFLTYHQWFQPVDWFGVLFKALPKLKRSCFHMKKWDCHLSRYLLLQHDGQWWDDSLARISKVHVRILRWDLTYHFPVDLQQQEDNCHFRKSRV